MGSRLQRAGLVLVGAALLTLASASSGLGGHAVPEDVFHLAVENTDSGQTQLTGSRAFGDLFRVTNTGVGATAIYGVGTNGNAIGVRGDSTLPDTSGIGVYGVFAPTSGTGDVLSTGVLGRNFNPGANGFGVWAEHQGTGRGLYATSVGGNAIHGLHSGAGSFGLGVLGETMSLAAEAAGVRGQLGSAAANAAGVRGHNSHPNCCGMGVFGSHAGQGIGVYGEAPSGFAISGFSPNNWSGYFQGNVRVVGVLLKNSGAFQIDHPLDPANKYLSHSFVESPDMKNVYDGVVRTDRRGFATVRLPSYFAALNRDFRYQLTIVGRNFAQALVWREIANNRFTIKTDRPFVKVSWQVTGIRKDRWANAHRIKVEEAKKPSERGNYLNPELFGKPLSDSVVVLPGAKKAARLAERATD